MEKHLNAACDDIQDLMDFLDIIYMAAAEITDHHRAPVRVAVIQAQAMAESVRQNVKAAREH